MPRCSMCGLEKPETDFAFQAIETRKRQDHCRLCHATYRREHYLRTKGLYVAREVARMRGYRDENRLRLAEYLAAHPCVDCGETELLMLEFDHHDPDSKRSEVSRLLARKPWARVLAEIEMCDVRCVACHRRRTAAQFRWRRASTGAWEVDQLQARPVEFPRRPEPTGERTCTGCGITRPLALFSMRSSSTGLRLRRCKMCHRAYSRAHYFANRERYLKKAAQHNMLDRDRLRDQVIRFLRAQVCIDCGETDTLLLDFDHRDRALKVSTVADLIRRRSRRAMFEEMAKCDIRCVRCHRRRTALQLGWHKASGIIDATRE